MKFKLEITLGNEAMRDGADIAHKLKDIALSVEHIMHDGLRGRTDAIRDVNGNTVGRWRVTEDKR